MSRKKVYLDRTGGEAVSVFLQDAEVIPAGTTIYSMPVKAQNAEYDRWAEAYDIHFIFDDRKPETPFYAVPWMDIFAVDSRGGYIGTLGQLTDMAGDAPVCYVDRDGHCWRIAENGPDFVQEAAHWRSLLQEEQEVRLYASREQAGQELEFMELEKMKYFFETEHLKIRKFMPEDAQSLYENHLEEEVKKWIPNESYADLEETQGAILFYRDCVNQGQLPYVLAVELRENGELIGDTGINEVEGNAEEVEIGYGICRKYSGKGYATELLKAMTEFAAETFGIRILYGRVMHGNNASVRVLEKNGYAFVTEEFGAEDDPYGKGMLIYKKEIKEQSDGRI